MDSLAKPVPHAEKHNRTNPLRDVILGGQDGLVNVLGIIFGVSAATTDTHILIPTVVAAAVAESISMGAVAYTSALSQKDYYESEYQRELLEIETVPDEERQELREIYKKKGITGEALDALVTKISEDTTVWVETMMSEELHLQPINIKQISKSSTIVGIATAIGSLIPLLPFFFLNHSIGLIFSVIISGIVLFAVGAYQAISLVGDWKRSGIKMVIIGLGAAFIGFIIAKLLHSAQ